MKHWGERMQPRELVRQWVDAFNHADVDALTAFYAEDAINHQVAEAPVQGRLAIRHLFEAGFSSATVWHNYAMLTCRAERPLAEKRQRAKLPENSTHLILSGQMAC